MSPAFGGAASNIPTGPVFQTPSTWIDTFNSNTDESSEGIYIRYMNMHGAFSFLSTMVFIPLGLFIQKFYEPAGKRWIVPFPAIIAYILAAVCMVISIGTGAYAFFPYDITLDIGKGISHVVFGCLVVVMMVVLVIGAPFLQIWYDETKLNVPLHRKVFSS